MAACLCMCLILSLSLSLTEKKYGPFHSASYTSRNTCVSVVSEKGPLLPSTPSGYYKLHTQMPPRSSSGSNKLFSSITFIPNLSIHKGAVFKCHISYKGKDKIVAERVSDKFTILGQRACWGVLVRSSPPGEFVFTHWQVIIMISGVFKLICSARWRYTFST